MGVHRLTQMDEVLEGEPGGAAATAVLGSDLGNRSARRGTIIIGTERYTRYQNDGFHPERSLPAAVSPSSNQMLRKICRWANSIQFE